VDENPETAAKTNQNAAAKNRVENSFRMGGTGGKYAACMKKIPSLFCGRVNQATS